MVDEPKHPIDLVYDLSRNEAAKIEVNELRKLAYSETRIK